ncbi:hypothetical protein [Bradyrhizobium iriomotense]|uniref:hypothetical protein n=1 Tax=Bradyrhizobium iriomotense TaxID=441950 RepID=UPI001B8A07D8|nr:hypothetical protein [Bradyrhizobium iriomotense]MBR0783511.1 hypothetical protein [Bradyrhizobium iriomotense]
MGPTTREVKLHIEQGVSVTLPGSGIPYLLPPGDYVGYLHETDAALDNAMLCLADTTIITRLRLAEHARPINFEVSRLIKSGEIEVIED